MIPLSAISEGEHGMKWQCQRANCGYIYDPEKGDRKRKIPAGARFEDLPEDWVCPLCGAGKHMFAPIHE
jgi:rubredoxin